MNKLLEKISDKKLYKRFYKIFLLIIIFLTGCQALYPTMNAQENLVTSVIEDFSILEKKDICPSNREVVFKDLGISNHLRLFMLSESNLYAPSSPFYLSSENSRPDIAFDTESLKYLISPDHKWFYFEKIDNNSQRPILWISSLDGKRQWPVIELKGDDYIGYATWVSEQEIFIIGSPNENDFSALDIWDYMPFLSINPFTLEKHQLKYLAESPDVGLYYYGATVSDSKVLGMYGRLNIVDFIYDFEQDKSIPTFSWLDNVEPFDMLFFRPIWAYDEGKFAVTIARPYGIDLAFDLDVTSVTKEEQYANVMKKVSLPEYLLPAYVQNVSESGKILFQRFDFLNPSEEGTWIYVLDYRLQTLIDYCLDVTDTIELVRFSPDGEFVAIALSRFETEDAENKNYIIVLNMTNGKITYINGFKLIDWGILP